MGVLLVKKAFLWIDRAQLHFHGVSLFRQHLHQMPSISSSCMKKAVSCFLDVTMVESRVLFPNN